jgi:hypothetical protein
LTVPPAVMAMTTWPVSSASPSTRPYLFVLADAIHAVAMAHGAITTNPKTKNKLTNNKFLFVIFSSLFFEGQAYSNSQTPVV